MPIVLLVYGHVLIATNDTVFLIHARSTMETTLLYRTS